MASDNWVSPAQRRKDREAAIYRNSPAGKAEAAAIKAKTPTKLAGERRYDTSKDLLKNRGVTKDHWETIQQWRVDEGKNFARSRGSQISRMSAAGMKVGSQQWEDNLATLDAAHAKEKTSQAGSATQGILDRWTAEMKGFYINATKTVDVRRGGGDRGEWTTTRASNESRALGGGKNVYKDSGLTEGEFMKLSTEDFMEMSFGHTEKFAEFNDDDGSTAAAAGVEGKRQAAARSQTKQASPWWG